VLAGSLVFLDIASAGAFPAPHLPASPAEIASGGRAVLSGSGWGASSRCQNSVVLLAYVVGVSTYPSVSLGKVSVTGGRMKLSWRAPKVEDSLPWTIRGEQRCGTTTLVAYTTVTIG
jgi:hypothetical protein